MVGMNRRVGFVMGLLSLLLILATACGTAEPTPAPAPTEPPLPPATEVAPATQVAPATAVVATTEPPTQPPPSPVPPTEAPPTEIPPTPVSPTPVSPTLPPPPPTLEPPPPGPFYEDRGSPVSLLASYVNAINRQEYARAWGYWENPPNPSFEDFQAGYSDTATVLLAAHPPTWYDGAAGSRYASVPTLLLATHADGSQHNFVGCYVVRSSNVEGAAPGWWLFDSTFSPTPGNSTDAGLMVDACGMPTSEPVYDHRDGPVCLLASYFNAINLGEYARAWDYWVNPPNPTFEDFRDGYSDTASVFLVVRPPIGYEGAAGSAYAQIPTLLLVTHSDSTQHNFLGCYVTQSPNLGPDAGTWSLFDATVQALPGTAADASLLAGACPTH